MRLKRSVIFGSFFNLFLQVIKHSGRLTRVGVSERTSVIIKTNYRGTIKQYRTIIEHYYTVLMCLSFCLIILFCFVFFSTQNARCLITRNLMTSAKQHQNRNPKRVPTITENCIKSLKL